MSYDIQYSETFKRGAKALAKKYPSIKQDLSNFVIDLAKTPDMGTPWVTICTK
jgi:mRNA-degrading endonuclease RelE of RelBE toxin-antitoxin system